MTTANILISLARSIRAHTRRYLSCCSLDFLTWAPAGTSNHILWHAGHAVWLQDALGLVPMTGRSYLPEGWRETFGQHSRPERTQHHWPSAKDVDEQLVRQLELWVHTVEQLPAHRWDDPEPHSINGWPLLQGVLHGWHDEAKHQGEMYLLLKMQQHASSQ